ncbi:MAG: hypothetical protein AVDCRST_MAG87-1304, partial [uncultured Thermomicrobiales bacterium]
CRSTSASATTRLGRSVRTCGLDGTVMPIIFLSWKAPVGQWNQRHRQPSD